MTYDTINDARTIAGSGEVTILAGRYRIVRQLGRGGMGAVWLAEDTQLDNKPFAIKMLPAILVANKRAYRQLKDEALVAMRLVHPNIVQIRAFEENDGNPFLVMDYIDGQTLDDYLAEKGKLPESDVLRILRPIAAALDYAHAKGVVHRDVKPGNVMIAKDGTSYILDFGIAREIQETLTRVTGKLSSGTLLYMSPEQLRGEMPKPTQDVYSFAAMVYECLKGEPPFSRGQVEFQILNEPPSPLPNGVGIGSSVMSGLAKKPETRPQGCAAVLSVPKARVRVARAPRPSSPKIGITAVPQERNVHGVALAIVFVVAILAVLGGMLWHREAQKRETMRRQAFAQRQAEEQRQQEEESARQAEEDARKKAKTEKDAREKEEIERRTKTEKSRFAAERKAKDAATEIRIEAKIQQGNVARISDADGFAERKTKLSFMFSRADAFFDEKTGMWNDAAQGFSNYVEQCNALIKLDGERETAVKFKRQAQQAFQTAEKAGAKTYAVTRWNEAVEIWQSAATEFGHMEFVSAGDKFASAAELFGKCLDEVREERERQDAAAAQAKAEQAARERAEQERRQREAEQKRIEAERLHMVELERRRRQQTFQAGTMKAITLPGGAEMRFLWCPPGSFMMGVPDHVYQQYPVWDKAHHVSIDDGFWMGSTEITQKQWATIMANTGVGLTTKDLMQDINNDLQLYNIGGKMQTLRSFYDKWQGSKFADWSLKLHEDAANMPIYYVSWNDAMKFCEQLTAVEKLAGHKIPDGYEYRLPTVEEWEYACRAGCNADLPNGNMYDVAHRNELVCPALNSIAWYKGNSDNRLREVATKNANNWGLYDMLGNVFEWCMTDQLGRDEYASIKGGSFRSAQRDCLPWTRGGWPKGFKMNSLGFRIVLAPILSRKIKD